MGGERKLAKKKKDLKIDMQQHFFHKYQNETNSTNEPNYQRIATQDVLSLIGSFDPSEMDSHLKELNFCFPDLFVSSLSLNKNEMNLEKCYEMKSDKNCEKNIQTNVELNFEKNTHNKINFALQKKGKQKQQQKEKENDKQNEMKVIEETELKENEIENDEELILERSEEEMNEDFDENEILLEENDFLMQ